MEPEAAVEATRRTDAAEIPLPPELRAKIESVRGELAGERREVAVIFADLSGFTALSERMDPEEVTVLVNRLLSQLSAEVHRYEGYVDKFIGDAVMALFGAPVAHENDAERAVLASLAMLDVIRRYNETADSPLALKIGINLGEVVAGHIGSGLRMQYTVIGDTVNVASRLEGKAAPNSILVTDAVHGRLGGRFEVEGLPPLQVKGREEPLKVHAIVGFRDVRPRPDASGLTPFVGRDPELARVTSLLDALVHGRGGALFVEGEAGAGKSRLVQEALAGRRGGLAEIEIAFSPVALPGQRPPLERILRKLTDAFGGGDPLARALALADEDAERHRAGIEDLLDPRAPETAAAGPDQVSTDPAAARENRWAALAALLRRAAADHPVLLVLEDVHWIDEGTREFLDRVSPTLVQAPVGLLLNGRPSAEAWRPGWAEVLELAPLGAAAADALLRNLLEDVAGPDRRELARRAQGNPLFLEELARDVSARPGHVVGAALPGTLQGLLVSRVDRLEPPRRLLLQMAAVLGSEFPTRLLERLFALEPQPVTFRAALAGLETDAFLAPVLNGEERHRFHQALVRDAAYGAMLLRIRRVLHESAARLGEEHYAGCIEREAAFFAHHWWEAGAPLQAAPHLWTAGRAAADNHELAEAERHLGRAAEAWAPDGAPADDPERAAFLETFGGVLLHRGRLDDAEARFRGLAALGAERAQPDWEARGLEHLGRLAWYRGRLDEARELFESGLAKLPADEGRISADLHNDLGIVYYYRGMEAEAFAQHERALRLREELGDRLGMAKSWSNIGNLLLHFRDDPEGAREHYRRGLELARDVGNRQMMSATTSNLGGVALELGDWEAALAAYRDVARLQEETGWTFLGWLALQNQARCELSLGRLADALRDLQRCADRGDAYLEPLSRVNTRLYLFDARLAAMQDAEAAAALDEARGLAAELAVELADEILLREGRLHAARGAWRDAERSFGEAEAEGRRLSHPSAADLARAHAYRSAAGGERDPGVAPVLASASPPREALLGYLLADARARRAPSAEVAAALAGSGASAGRLGDVALSRAAHEREAEVREAVGDADGARAAREVATAALQALEAGLPEDARTAFRRHPRNARLLYLEEERSGAGEGDGRGPAPPAGAPPAAAGGREGEGAAASARGADGGARRTGGLQ
ncbi:MAG TPA: adenylate/guanylate cyclase domain-containing protein [Gemmatimonadota bacterium]